MIANMAMAMAIINARNDRFRWIMCVVALLRVHTLKGKRTNLYENGVCMRETNREIESGERKSEK